MQVDPGCVWAARALFEVIDRLGAAGGAARGAKRAADANPRDAALQLIAAQASLVAKDGDAARRYVERAASLRPEQPLLHATWGNWYSRFARPRDIGHALAEWER